MIGLQGALDFFMVIVMFVLRIGIPIAVTIAAGKWLEKRLQHPMAETQTTEQTDAASRFGQDGKIIYLHCWDFKRCDPTERAHCPAFQQTDLPCWLAIQVRAGHIRQECLSCALYKPQRMAA